MAGSSSSGNSHKPVDWSYDSVSDAPNFLSFDNDASSPAGRSNFGGRRSRTWRPYNRGRHRGHPDFQGPPVRYDHRPPRRAPFPYRQPFQPHQPHRYGPPEPFRGRRFNNNWSYGRGNPQNRGGRYGGRSRGGFNLGAPGGPDVPISAYFHPSMLEDPWAPQTATKGSSGVENPKKTVDVVVPHDDPELLELCAQMKGNAEAEAVAEEGDGSATSIIQDEPMKEGQNEDSVVAATLADEAVKDVALEDTAMTEPL